MNGINRALSHLYSRLGAVRGEQGQTLAEYSLIVTVVAVGVVMLAVFLFSSALGGSFDSVTTCLVGGCS